MVDQFDWWHELLGSAEEKPAPVDYRSLGQILDSRQWRFVRISGEVVPEMWADLRVQVFPTYVDVEQTAPHQRSRYAQALHGRHTLSAQLDLHMPESFIVLAGKVREWQSRWNLTPFRGERYALGTMHWWTFCPNDTSPRPTSLGGVYIDPRPMPERPQSTRAFRDANAHRHREGWRPFKPLNEQHLRWLALYQCRGESARAIGWEYTDGPDPPTEEAIYKSIQRCARALCLPIRTRLS